MKNIFDIILENFQLFLTGLFCIFICLLTGQFGLALIVGIILAIVCIIICIACWKDKHNSSNNFKKWTKGK